MVGAPVNGTSLVPQKPSDTVLLRGSATCTLSGAGLSGAVAVGDTITVLAGGSNSIFQARRARWHGPTAASRQGDGGWLQSVPNVTDAHCPESAEADQQAREGPTHYVVAAGAVVAPARTVLGGTPPRQVS